MELLEHDKYEELSKTFFSRGDEYFTMVLDNVTYYTTIEWIYYFITCNVGGKKRIIKNDIRTPNNESEIFSSERYIWKHCIAFINVRKKQRNNKTVIGRRCKY